MVCAKTGITNKIRCKLKPGMVFSTRLFEGIGTTRQIHNTLMRMRKAGEVETINKGLYQYLKSPINRTKKEVIWHLVRSHRRFKKAVITQLSEASHETVKTYFVEWRKKGFLKLKKKYVWQLVNDPGPEVPK